jgi:hypothetical protein
MPSIRDEEMANLDAISVSRLGSPNTLLFDAMVIFRFILLLRYKQVTKDSTYRGKPVQTPVCSLESVGLTGEALRWNFTEQG